jgi:hypothetical protein
MFGMLDDLDQFLGSAPHVKEQQTQLGLGTG